MSDFPEKDRLTEPQESIPTLENTEPKSGEEPQSTIFVKHIYNTKKPAKKGNIKRIVICSVAALLCGAIIGSIFLVKNMLPERSSSTVSVAEEERFDILKFSDLIKPSIVSIGGKDIEVESNIQSVYFVNNLEEFTCLPEYIKAEKKENTSSSSSTSSSNKKTYDYNINWCVKDLDTKLTVSNLISEKIQECLNIQGFRKMENTFESVEEYHQYYGITDKLTAGCVVKFNDATETLTIKLGSSVAGGDAFYFLTSLSDTIYLVEAEYAKHFICTTKEFAEPTVIDPIVKTDDIKSYYNDNSGALARYDSIKLSGDAFGGKVYDFKLATGASADYMPYLMVAPYRRPADNEFITEMISLAENGLEATAMFSYTSTEKDREAYNIKSPKAVIEFKLGKYSYKLMIGGIVGQGTDSQTRSVMIEGKPQIFGVPAESFDFLMNASNDVTKMFNEGFILEDIYTIKSLEMTDKTGTHKFDLKHTLREGETSVYDTVVKKGSTEMNTLSFKILYQRILMLSLTEYVLEQEYTDPVLTVKYNYIEGGSKLVEFTEATDDVYHYTAWVDGTPLGEVVKSSVEDIIKCLEIYLAGGDVPDTWVVS